MTDGQARRRGETDELQELCQELAELKSKRKVEVKSTASENKVKLIAVLSHIRDTEVEFMRSKTVTLAYARYTKLFMGLCQYIPLTGAEHTVGMDTAFKKRLMFTAMQQNNDGTVVSAELNGPADIDTWG